MGIKDLTTEIQVDRMTKITTARNPSEKRSNGYKLEENCFWIYRHSLEPVWVTMWEHITSSFRANDSEALSTLQKQVQIYIYIYLLLSLPGQMQYVLSCPLTSLEDVSVMLVNGMGFDWRIRLKTSGTYDRKTSLINHWYE